MCYQTYIPVSHIAAFAQDGNGQERGLDRLAAYRNTEVVAMCTRTAAILLTCPLVGNDLPITDRVHVTSVRFAIQLCNSSLLVNLTLSNGTELNAVNFAQCDTSVPLGQSRLAIDVAVFVDSDGLTVINTSVSTINLLIGWYVMSGGKCPSSLFLHLCCNVLSR